MGQPNELDNLSLDSLKRLSEEFDEREAHDRVVERVRDVVRGAVERTQGAVRRGLEALGQFDTVAPESDGATGRLACLVAEEVTPDDVRERGRESDWSR